MNFNDIRAVMSLILVFFVLGGMTYTYILISKKILPTSPEDRPRPLWTAQDCLRWQKITEDRLRPPKTAKDCQRPPKIP